MKRQLQALPDKGGVEIGLCQRMRREGQPNSRGEQKSPGDFVA